MNSFYHVNPKGYLFMCKYVLVGKHYIQEEKHRKERFTWNFCLKEGRKAIGSEPPLVVLRWVKLLQMKH